MSDVKAVKASHKFREWFRRYVPGEVAGTLSAFSAAFLVHTWTGSLGAAAIAGAWAEGVGYYSTAGLLELRRTPDPVTGLTQTFSVFRLAIAIRTLMIEFGPAEFMDTAFVRPTLMYVAPLMLGSFGWGLLVGKLAADVVFYAFVIVVYEWRKRARAGYATTALHRPSDRL